MRWPAVEVHGRPLLYFCFLPRERGQPAGLVLLRFPRWKPAPQPGTLRWGDFLIGQKVTKDPPKAGPSPALWNPPRGTGYPCVLLFSALDWFLSHRWRRHSMGRACSSVDGTSTPQGLTLVSRCTQQSWAWLPAAGTPLGQGRPGCGNRPAVGPAAQGNLVWWQYQEPQQESRAEPRHDAVPASYPRGVLRGERPKWLFVHFGQSKWTPSGERVP